MGSSGVVAVEAPPKAKEEVIYPETDGRPMAETDEHASLLIYLREGLRDRFRDDPQVYVAGNLLVYYEEGNPKASVAPDVFVVFGVSAHERRIYKVWEEGKGPDVVIELTSLSTRDEDLGQKRVLYERLGVREYFIFDPFAEHLSPPLVGFVREGEWFAPMAVEPLDGGWRVRSELLGVELQALPAEEGRWELRVVDAVTGEKMLTPLEAQEKARREAEARRRAEEQSRWEAEARCLAEERLRELEEELARLRARLGES